MTVERLISVAQRLDELAEEHGIPELATLSEEMGLVAERWPSDRPLSGPNSEAPMPRYLRDIQQIVEHEMHDRVRGGVDFTDDDFFRQQAYQQYTRLAARLPAPDLSKFITP